MRVTVGRHIGIAAGSGCRPGGRRWMSAPIPSRRHRGDEGRFVASVDEDGKTRDAGAIHSRGAACGAAEPDPLQGRRSVQVDDAVAAITPSPAPLMDPRSPPRG